MLFAPSILHGAIYRVDANTGQDIPACGGEATPCASIQQAVNLSISGDTILAAEATYTHQAGVDPCITETAVVCIVEKELTLLGGYSSGDWVTRDPAANPTVIDGENFQRGLLVMRTHPGSPNSASLVLDGFTIRQGRAAGTPSAPEDRMGGGLKAALVESLLLRDIIFENNTAQGGDTSSDDGGNGVGGGAYVSSSVSLPPTHTTMIRVKFSGNQALGGTGPERGGMALGGGLFINRSDFTAAAIVFENNTASAGSSPGDGEFNGQRADALGGGMAILAGTEATIDNFDASGNSSIGGSSTGIGGVGAGGGVYAEASSLRLRDSHLRGNTSHGGTADIGGLGDGGGLAAFDATVAIDRVAFIENQAIGGDGTTTKGAVGGGGGYLERANDPSVNVSVLNSVVADNSVAFGTGGGIVGGGGGGLFVLGNDAVISHTTLARNTVGSDPLAGQAITVVPRLGSSAHADIEHTIIADHTALTNVPAVQVRPGASVAFDGGLFAGNDRDTTDGMLETGTITGLDTVLNASTAGFVSPGSPDFDYHIVDSSAAVNQATASSEALDYDKTYRSGVADIGADEHCSSASDDLLLADEVVDYTVTELACRSITAGPYTVQSPGDVVFQAGGRVVLKNGFRLEDGAVLQIIISLPQ
jgi:hypothetical protein